MNELIQKQHSRHEINGLIPPLDSIDLERSGCPDGFTVEVNGNRPIRVDTPRITLLDAIAYAYVVCTGHTIYPGDFLPRVRLLAIDSSTKNIKVAVTSLPSSL